MIFGYFAQALGCIRYGTLQTHASFNVSKWIGSPASLMKALILWRR
jgi:hypothetical protein